MTLKLHNDYRGIPKSKEPSITNLLSLIIEKFINNLPQRLMNKMQKEKKKKKKWKRRMCASCTLATIWCIGLTVLYNFLHSEDLLIDVPYVCNWCFPHVCKPGDALYALKSSLVDPKDVLQSWDTSSGNPCIWFHVTCNGDGNVIRV